MRKYEEYKDSGHFLLKEIPNKWSKFRFTDKIELKHGFQFREDDFTDEGLKIVKITQLSPKGYLDLSNCSFIDTKRLNIFRSIIIKNGDVLMALTGGTIGKIIRAENISEPLLQNYRVGNFFPSTKDLDKIYMFYLLSSQNTMDQINYLINRNGQPNIGKENFKNMTFPLPSFSEQQAIANYLDAKTQAIDKKVSLLEQKIETYKKLKRTLINQTITKGLDKNAPLKDSGISWIGQIPQHWEVKRLKDIFNTFSGGTPSTKVKEYWNGNLPWIPSGKVQNNIIDRKVVENFISQDALKESSTKMAKSGSLLIALTGATCSNIGLLTFDTTINQSIVALNQKKDIEKKFFFYFLISASLKIRSSMTGGAQAGINQEDVKFLDLLLPPKSEQEEIAKYLDHKTATIDAIVGNISKQIETLKQLRKTLINDVVTGKIKVVE